jgi:hypothetical protein
MNDQPTPETDAVLDRFLGSRKWQELTDLSCKLERERNKARKSLDEMSKHLAQATAQRDHAETEMRKWMAFVKEGAK